MSDLSTLKNIGNTSAYWLKAVGINTFDELQAVGAVEAYIRIQKFGIKTTKALLYSLHGAIQDIHWKDIDAVTKQQLCDEAALQLKNKHAL